MLKVVVGFIQVAKEGEMHYILTSLVVLPIFQEVKLSRIEVQVELCANEVCSKFGCINLCMTVSKWTIFYMVSATIFSH